MTLYIVVVLCVKIQMLVVCVCENPCNAKHPWDSLQCQVLKDLFIEVCINAKVSYRTVIHLWF